MDAMDDKSDFIKDIKNSDDAMQVINQMEFCHQMIIESKSNKDEEQLKIWTKKIIERRNQLAKQREKKIRQLEQDKERERSGRLEERSGRLAANRRLNEIDTLRYQVEHLRQRLHHANVAITHHIQRRVQDTQMLDTVYAALSVIQVLSEQEGIRNIILTDAVDNHRCTIDRLQDNNLRMERQQDESQKGNESVRQVCAFEDVHLPVQASADEDGGGAFADPGGLVDNDDGDGDGPAFDDPDGLVDNGDGDGEEEDCEVDS